MLKKRKIKFRFVILLFLSPLLLAAQEAFVHPGISHKLSDLERMKQMVEAGKEPWLTTYNKLKASSNASYNYNVSGNTGITSISSHSAFMNDGYAAYHNALMWYITGDARHAEKCVEIFNAWVNLKRIEDQFPLNNGRGPWKMLEGAEIIKHTYGGWAEADQEKFKAMLVYPGWSGTEEPTAAIKSKDVTFYWNIYQGDRARHGNQGLFAYRSMMAMGIFCENEIMYERALRYLQGLPHRSDDLPYPSGPPITKLETSGNEYYEEYSITSYSTEIEDYGYNEVIANYIWENGQGQESSRDQAHGLGGVSIITCMCEMAWNQGDDLYGHLDNRPLLGLEYYFRYNLSWEHSYEDQPEPWEPTVESGEFIESTDRSGRWKSLKINPYTGANLTENDWNRGRHNLNPIYEMNLGHYKNRLLLDSEKFKWLQRGFEVLTTELGVEDGVNPVDHPGWGGLKFRRVSPGDPIKGFTEDGLPKFKMNELPTTIEAENYDYFSINGDGRTYHDLDESNTGNKYRLDEGVDIDTCSAGGYMLTNLQNSEWLTYTIAVPSTGLYNISINYATANANGKLKFYAEGENVTEELTVPFGGENSTGLSDFKDYQIASDVILARGVQALKIEISGESDAFVLNKISITEGSDASCDNTFPDVSVLTFITPGINFKYYEGTWDNLPDFSTLTPVESGINGNIELLDAWSENNFAAVYTGYIDIPLDGSYTFYTSSDEGSRLFIDGNLFVDNDGIHAETEVSGEVCLEVGYHAIRVEYFEKIGDEGLTVQYEGLGISKRNLEGLYAIGDCENAAVELPEGAVAGLGYHYYKGTWTLLPDFENLELLGMGTTSTVNLNMASVSDHFGVVFTGYINVANDGDYTFYTTSDDGSSLYIDGNRIVNNDGTHGPEIKSGNTCLAAGWHRIEVQYFESTGGQSLSVQWSGDGFTRRNITGFYTEPITAPVKQNQTITFNSLTRYLGEEDFDAATASSGLPLAYISNNLAVATVVDGKIHLVGEGQARISASQSGNLFFNAANGAEYITVGAKESQTITISDITKYLGDDDFDPAVTSSGLPISYASFKYSVATIVDGKIHLIAPGTALIRASQEGNNMFLPAPSKIFTLTVDEQTAIKDLTVEGINVYPNPAEDYLTIEGSANSRLEIFNTTGQKVYEEILQSEKHTISMQALANGIYIIKLLNDGTTKTGKLIKQ